MGEMKDSNGFPKKFLWEIIFIGLAIVITWLLLFKAESIFQEPEESMPQKEQKEQSLKKNSSISLPQPAKDSQTSIEETLLQRRSVRDYKDEPLSLAEVSQILWAAQGITSTWGGRTAPSAGALYPLEVCLVVRKAESISPGAYRYIPEGHKLERIVEGDLSEELARAGVSQMFIKEAPVNLVFSGVYSRTMKKYGERGIRYVHLEAGHAAQNVYLQVVSLGLGAVVVGAFYDEEVKQILNLADDETPLYIMPVGKPR